MLHTYKVEQFQEEESILYLPAGFRLEEDILPHTVILGTRRQSTACKRHPNGRNVIGISTGLARKLYLPSKVVSLSLFCKDECLYAGVLIGIFTAGFTGFRLSPIGQRSHFFKQLLSVQSSLGVIPFVFGERHIDWENGLIKGFFHFGEGWEIEEIPFPNVIYDRLPNRRSEKRKTYQSLKERLEREYGIPWYNPGFFNKLDLFERLENDQTVRHFLPDTQPFQSFDEMERLLSAYHHIYLKPKNGSLGNGIHKITYNRTSEEYYCRFRDGDQKNRLLKFKSLEQLSNTVFRNRNLDTYIVQQGISLLKENNRPIDFRVHTNKDEEGNWQVSALAGKVAGSGSVTTHANNGGEVKVLSELFTDEKERGHIEEALKDAALLLSHAIERNLEGYIGEIGFDFGVDEKHHIWMFEANSKPGRSIFSHPDLKSFDLLTRKLALSFGIFLTQQSLHHPEEMIP
ncbi:glutathione synthetase [Bacillus sp. AFS015802]|uniref:YheC/YheD family endospore coat-associated protein n=1 Tax=Bacillus sp. AFS015802 TaxID=2033486 RepID=UPI000BF5603E|nr:YheC/YheD family protein [Bacillus sp. AFS015802]PFA62593.1 glutathione synthetase [Bacillus sp. AFS015802]